MSVQQNRMLNVNDNRKIYILRDINYFFKMSVSECLCYQIFYTLQLKNQQDIKTKFYIQISYRGIKS